MLSFKIDELLSQKNKSKYWLAKQCDMSEHAIGKLCKNETSRIEIVTIEKICKVLECTPNDILVSDDPQMQRLLLYSSKLNKLQNTKGDTE